MGWILNPCLSEFFDSAQGRFHERSRCPTASWMGTTPSPLAQDDDLIREVTQVSFVRPLPERTILIFRFAKSFPMRLESVIPVP